MNRLILVFSGLAAVWAVAGCNSKAREADGGGAMGGGAGGVGGAAGSAGGGTGAVGNPDQGSGGSAAGAGGASAGASGANGGAVARGGTGGAAAGAGGSASGGHGGTGGGAAGAGGSGAGGRSGTGGGAAGAGGSGAGGRGGVGGAGGIGGGALACAFAYTYTAEQWSGADTNDRLVLTPPNSFHYMGETPFLNDAGVVTRPSCDPAMPACNDPARIDVSDIEAAIANVDVQAAFAAATPIKCGSTSTLSSFPLFSFGHDQVGFSCGPDCSPASSNCTPIPPGIKALIDLVHALEAQQLSSDPACSGVH